MAVDKNELILQFKFQSQKANTNVKKTNSALGNLRIKASGVRREIGGLRNDLLLASFAFAGVSAAIGKVVGVSARFEAVKTRLVGLTGSVENAEKAFDNFNKVAATTPFTLDDVVDAGAQLQAFGADAEALIVPITDLAAFMGTTAVEAANAFGRAFAGGAGAADILRERGILNIIKTSKGLTDLSKTTLPEFREALITSIQDPVVGIAGSSERLSKTFTGLTSNMIDSFTRLADSIGDSLMPVIRPLFETLKSGAERAERFIRGLTETSLETAIRELKEFEGTASQIADLQRLNLNVELRDIQRTLRENNVEFKSSEEAQKALNIALEKAKSLSITQGELAIQSTLTTEKQKDLEEQITDLTEKKRGSSREEFLSISEKQKALIAERADLINKASKLEEIVESNKDDVKASRDQVKELASVLTKLKEIEEIRDILADKPRPEPPVIPDPPKPEGDDEDPEDKEEKRQDAIRKSAAVFREFGKNISDAVVHGENLGEAVVASIKAIAAQIIAQQATLMLLRLFFDNVTAGEAGLNILESIGILRGKFHDGGLIGGNGNNVPIMAQSGEFVMQRSAVQSIGLENLTNMNETGQSGNVINVSINGGIVDEGYVRNTLLPALSIEGVSIA